MRLQSVAGAPVDYPDLPRDAPVCVEVMSAAPAGGVEVLVDELRALCAASLAVQIKAGRAVIKLLNLTGLARPRGPRQPDRADAQRAVGTRSGPGVRAAGIAPRGDRGGGAALRRAVSARFPELERINAFVRALGLGSLGPGADPAVDPPRPRSGRIPGRPRRRGPPPRRRDVARPGRRGALVDGPRQPGVRRLCRADFNKELIGPRALVPLRSCGRRGDAGGRRDPQGDPPRDRRLGGGRFQPAFGDDVAGTPGYRYVLLSATLRYRWRAARPPAGRPLAVEPGGTTRRARGAVSPDRPVLDRRRRGRRHGAVAVPSAVRLRRLGPRRARRPRSPRSTGSTSGCGAPSAPPSSATTRRPGRRRVRRRGRPVGRAGPGLSRRPPGGAAAGRGLPSAAAAPGLGRLRHLLGQGRRPGDVAGRPARRGGVRHPPPLRAGGGVDGRPDRRHLPSSAAPTAHEWFAVLVSAAGGIIEFAGPEEHDRIMAYVQSASHQALLAFADVVANSGHDIEGELWRLRTPVFETLLGLASRVLSPGQEETTASIQLTTEGARIAAEFDLAQDRLRSALRTDDAQTIASYIASTREAFGGTFFTTLQQVSNLAVEATQVTRTRLASGAAPATSSPSSTTAPEGVPRLVVGRIREITPTTVTVEELLIGTKGHAVLADGSGLANAAALGVSVGAKRRVVRFGFAHVTVVTATELDRILDEWLGRISIDVRVLVPESIAGTAVTAVCRSVAGVDAASLVTEAVRLGQREVVVRIQVRADRDPGEVAGFVAGHVDEAYGWPAGIVAPLADARVRAVAYLGPAGTFSEIAARQAAGIVGRPDAALVACAGFEAVIAAVVAGDAELAVLPIVNSASGLVELAAAGLLASRQLVAGGVIDVSVRFDAYAATDDLAALGASRRLQPPAGDPAVLALHQPARLGGGGVRFDGGGVRPTRPPGSRRRRHRRPRAGRSARAGDGRPRRRRLVGGADALPRARPGRRLRRRGRRGRPHLPLALADGDRREAGAVQAFRGRRTLRRNRRRRLARRPRRHDEPPPPGTEGEDAGARPPAVVATHAGRPRPVAGWSSAPQRFCLIPEASARQRERRNSSNGRLSTTTSLNCSSSRTKCSTPRLAASREAGLPGIQVTPNQGKFLQLLARACGARRDPGGRYARWLQRHLAGSSPAGRWSPGHTRTRTQTRRGCARQSRSCRPFRSRRDPSRSGPGKPRRAPATQKRSPFDFTFIDADRPHVVDYFCAAGGVVAPPAA